jgi:hypothetical protein
MSEIIIPGGSTHSAEGVGDRDPEEVGQEAHHEPDCGIFILKRITVALAYAVSLWFQKRNEYVGIRSFICWH